MEPTKEMDGKNNLFNTQASKRIPDLPSLPEELVTYIFSNLNDPEIHSTHITNRAWNSITEKYDKSSFSTLVNWLVAHLANLNVDQKKALKIASFTEQIIEILKKLDINDLEILSKTFKSENKHQRFENLFNLILIYKRIDTIENKTQKKTRDLALSKTVGSLVAFGKLEKALAIAKTIDCTPFRNKAILNIVRALGKLHLYKNNQYNGRAHYNCAIKIVNILEKYDYSENFDPKKFDSIEEFNITVFVTLGLQLFMRNPVDKVIEFANLFNDKDVILENMAIEQALKRPESRNKKILELVNKISDPLSKDIALHHILSFTSHTG